MLLSIIFFLLGLGVLIKGADWLVSGGAQIARIFKLSPLIIGMSIIAIGTSLPELVVGVIAVLSGSGNIAVGDVIGSNICNIALVLGVASVVRPLGVEREIFKRDMPVLLGAVFFLWLFGRNYGLTRIEGIAFLVFLLAYLVYLIIRRQAPNKEVTAGMISSHWIRKYPWVAILIGILGITLGAKFMVDYGVKIAKFIGVSEAVIGLTMIAIGTSLPELATSTVAAMRHEHGISIGNILGSNILNILMVLGCVATIRPIRVDPRLFRIDLWVMLGYSVVLFPLLFTGSRLSRKEGWFLLITYTIYITYLYGIRN